MENIKSYFKTYQQNNEEVDDQSLDSLLGIKIEESQTDWELTRRFGLEQYKYEATPYGYIRYFLDQFPPSQEDVIYDLGAGYGRVILYGALVCPAKFIGIELVPDRVKNALEIKKRLNLTNADFIYDNALNRDFSDGTIFFLFNPFTDETLIKIGDKLKEIAKHHSIKVITWGGPSNQYFSMQPWLEEVFCPGNNTKMQFFQSI